MAGANFLNFHSIVDGDMSGNITGDAMECRQFLGHGAQAIWSGTSPAGTVFYQISNDGGSTWTSITGGSTVSGNSGSDIPDSLTDAIWLVQCELMRAIYTRTSGTGTLNVYLIGRG